MLAVRQVIKRFGAFTALAGVSLDAPVGEIGALIGPNGAGKSTLLGVIAGYIPPTAGTISIGGLDVWRAPLPARRLTGYLPEGSPLYGDLRVEEHLRYRARLKGLHGRRLRARLRHVVGACGLGEIRRRLIARLSLGQRQRVGLADAILTEPRLLLLDEPFAALDPLQTEQTCRLLAGMARHCAILLATHRLDLLPTLCRRCTVMARGRAVQVIAIDESTPVALLAALRASAPAADQTAPEEAPP